MQKALQYIKDLGSMGTEGEEAAHAMMRRTYQKHQDGTVSGHRVPFHTIIFGDLETAKDRALLSMRTVAINPDPAIADYFETKYGDASNEWWKTMGIFYSAMWGTYRGDVTFERMKRNLNIAVATRMLHGGDGANEGFEIQLTDLELAATTTLSNVECEVKDYPPEVLRRAGCKLGEDGWLQQDSR